MPNFGKFFARDIEQHRYVIKTCGDDDFLGQVHTFIATDQELRILFLNFQYFFKKMGIQSELLLYTSVIFQSLHAFWLGVGCDKGNVTYF
ncbi:hypothetical protein D3C81_1742160 [compost metagenome]